MAENKFSEEALLPKIEDLKTSINEGVDHKFALNDTNI
jgi:hypothetical protein